jgi:hypothetical protein
MRFTLENLGRLEEATIDLGKDLIVLTGPNNTSKTYVVHAIYGLCQRIGSILRDILVAVLRLDAPATYRTEIDLPALLSEHLAAWLPRMGETYSRLLADVFAAGDDFVERSRVRLDITEGERKQREQALRRLEFHKELGGEGRFAAFGRVTVEKAADSSRTTVTWTPSFSRTDAGVEGDLSYFSQLVLSFVSSVLAEMLFFGADQAYILPAERSAIQLFSRELSVQRNEVINALVGAVRRARAERYDLGFDLEQLIVDNERRYPLAIRDSLRTSESLAILRKGKRSVYEPFAAELERDVVQGTVELDERGDTMFHPAGSAKRIDLHLSSSSVKSLSGLSFYLRYLAQRGQFLIIDEPELNLHPESQVKVARLLARLARSGIKVMISTHSDHIIREINNLVMLSADRDGAVRAKHGYTEEETLSPERVGAYVFDGAHGYPLPLGPGGMEVAAINEVIRAQDRAAQDIYFSLVERDEA